MKKLIIGNCNNCPFIRDEETRSELLFAYITKDQRENK